MSEKEFKPGDVVKHVYFDTELFIVKVLHDGKIGCRYKSYNRTEKNTSEFILHYAEFEPFEIVPVEPRGNTPFTF